MMLYFHIGLIVFIFISSFLIFVQDTKLSAQRLKRFIPLNYDTKINVWNTSEPNKTPILNKQKRSKFKSKLLFNYKQNKIGLLLKAGFQGAQLFAVFMFIEIFIALITASILFTSYFKDINFTLIFAAIFILIDLLTIPYLKHVSAVRIQEIRNSIPNLLDFMIICSNAGYTIPKIFKITAIQLNNSNPIIAKEIATTAVEFELTSDVEKTLERLNERIPLREIQIITTTLLNSYHLGSSLKNQLQTISHDIINEKMFKIEERAGKIPAILIMPMVFCILPCLFVIILGPVIIKAIETMYQ